MEHLELAYESKGSRNYLSVKSTDKLSVFQTKMLENNQIPCLLSMHSRSLNGVYCLDYDITGVNRLIDVLDSHQIYGNKAKKMLWELLDGLLSIEEYFLTYTQCVLELDYIYFSYDEKPCLVYLPLKNSEITTQETVKELFQDLLVNYFVDENEQFFMDLLRYVNKKDFSVPGLYRLLKDSIGQSLSVQENVIQEPVCVEEKPKSIFGHPVVLASQEPAFAVVQETPKTKGLFGRLESKSAHAQVTPKASETPVPPTTPVVPPIAIPSVGSSIPRIAPALAKPEKEKKPLFSFSSGSKKEKSVAGNIPLVTPQVIPTEPEAPTPQKTKGGLFSKSATPQKTKGSLFGKSTTSTSSPTEASMQNQMPVGVTPTTEQWKGTVMISNDIGAGKTIMMGMDESFPCLRHAGNTINLDHFPFVIGKQNADYTISKGVISRTHASIISKKGSYYIKDENSSNHTYVNGVQIPPFTEREIYSGDRIRLADEELEFNVEG